MKWRWIQMGKWMYWVLESDLHVFSALMDSALVLVQCILKQTENNHCQNHIFAFSLNMGYIDFKVENFNRFQ